VQVSKTEKRYLDDAYTAEFRSVVVGCEPLSGGGHAVVLDKTFFYPASGGQSPDTGRIAGCEVVDVQEGDGDAVVHAVSGEAPPAGEVECRVDWDRRFDHMQQHTGQHVLSRAFIETAGLHTVSFHMGEDGCTIDLEGGAFSEEAAERAESLANRVIEENRPVRVRTVPVEELDETELRRKVPEGVRDARLVEVADFDVIPCCGTHVRATGELAAIKVVKWEKVKAARRVHFVVGRRALDDYARKHAIVHELASRFTTGTSEITSKVDKLVAENLTHKKSIKALSQRLAGLEADALLAAAGRMGVARVVARLVEGDGGYARAVASVIQSKPGTIAVVGAADGTVVCAASDDLDIDVAAAAVERAKRIGGSGGGKPGFAQIRLPQDAAVAEFIQQVEADVTSKL
jgi:alanyl-tRNA synthetase